MLWDAIFRIFVLCYLFIILFIIIHLLQIDYHELPQNCILFMGKSYDTTSQQNPVGNHACVLVVCAFAYPGWGRFFSLIRSGVMIQIIIDMDFEA